MHTMLSMAVDFFLSGDGATGHGHHSLVWSLKECMSRRNLISQKVRPGIDILCRFLNIQHLKVAHATQIFFSNDAQLRSCHKCFSYYHQPPGLHQSVLIFEQFAAANVKALIFLYLVRPTSGSSDVWSAPKLRSTVVLDTLQYSCVYS